MPFSLGLWPPLWPSLPFLSRPITLTFPGSLLGSNHRRSLGAGHRSSFFLWTSSPTHIWIFQAQPGSFLEPHFFIDMEQDALSQSDPCKLASSLDSRTSGHGGWGCGQMCPNWPGVQPNADTSLSVLFNPEEQWRAFPEDSRPTRAFLM